MMFNDQGKVWKRKECEEKQQREKNQVDRMRGRDVYEYVQKI